MTKEELDKIAKRYAQDELKDNHGQVEDIVAAAFLNGIDYAEHHPRWISVEDELPIWNDVYLTCTDGNVIEIAYYELFGGHWVNDSKGIVTHWMPLPQPPKKGGEQ